MRRVCAHTLAFTTLEVDIFNILATTAKPGSQLVAPGRSESFAMESHVLAMRILVHKLAALCESIA